MGRLLLETDQSILVIGLEYRISGKVSILGTSFHSLSISENNEIYSYHIVGAFWEILE